MSGSRGPQPRRGPPSTWQHVLNAPAFVINLDDRPERLTASLAAIRHAGFGDVRRFAAIDARDDDALAEVWRAVGSPAFAPWDGGFARVPGKQGCFLSHLALWAHIVERDLPVAAVFEDDVLFHRHWWQLAPTCFGFTPRDYDVVFMGAMMANAGRGLVRKVPVDCTHAYFVTSDGAARLLRSLLADPDGVGSIDIMLHRLQQRALKHPTPDQISWYAWNGTAVPDARTREQPEWEMRNSGIVFQDYRFGSDIGTDAGPITMSTTDRRSN